jgi:sugar lactone lactonase YvrE
VQLAQARFARRTKIKGVRRVEAEPPTRVIRRSDGEVLSIFGRMGRYAGQFHVPHNNIAADSQGNLYISEVDTGQRVQRFRRTDQQ